VTPLNGDLARVRDAIINCERCPRLRTYCRRIAQQKRAAFRHDTYWARPVAGFGDPAARIAIIGLAPAAHGANRTGRNFTGDGAGGSGDGEGGGGGVKDVRAKGRGQRAKERLGGKRVKGGRREKG
jgi:hypothetical protein